jgi:hypothetical protein
VIAIDENFHSAFSDGLRVDGREDPVQVGLVRILDPSAKADVLDRGPSGLLGIFLALSVGSEDLVAECGGNDPTLWAEEFHAVVRGRIVACRDLDGTGGPQGLNSHANTGCGGHVQIEAVASRGDNGRGDRVAQKRTAGSSVPGQEDRPWT